MEDSKEKDPAEEDSEDLWHQLEGDLGSHGLLQCGYKPYFSSGPPAFDSCNGYIPTPLFTDPMSPLAFVEQKQDMSNTNPPHSYVSSKAETPIVVVGTSITPSISNTTNTSPGIPKPPPLATRDEDNDKKPFVFVPTPKISPALHSTTSVGSSLTCEDQLKKFEPKLPTPTSKVTPSHSKFTTESSRMPLFDASTPTKGILNIAPHLPSNAHVPSLFHQNGQATFPYKTSQSSPYNPLSNAITSSHQLAVESFLLDLHKHYASLFMRNSCFLEHNRKTQEFDRRVYRCTRCSLEFPNAQAFGGHMSSHSKSRKNQVKTGTQQPKVARRTGCGAGWVSSSSTTILSGTHHRQEEATQPSLKAKKMKALAEDLNKDDDAILEFQQQNPMGRSLHHTEKPQITLKFEGIARNQADASPAEVIHIEEKEHV